MGYSNPLVERRVAAFVRGADRRTLDLSDTGAADADLERVAREPAARRLAVLDLNGTAVDSAGLGCLTGLRWLRDVRLEDTRVDDDGMGVLAGLPSLAKLAVGGTGVGDAGLARVASARSLTWLDLFETRVTDEGLGSLAGLRLLRHLNLGGTGVGDRGVRRLAPLRGLRELILERTLVGDAGVRHLAVLRLRRLDLGGTEVTDRGLADLAAATSLEHVDLFDTRVGGAGLARIAGLPRLANLGLNGTDVTDRDLGPLAGSAALVALGLSRTRVGEDGVRLLGDLPKLRELAASETAVGDRGVRSLAGCPGLERLYLRDTDVGDDGAEHLATFPGLAVLNLAGTRVGDRAVRALASLARLESLLLSDCPNVADLSPLGALLPARGGRLRRLRVGGCPAVPEEAWDHSDPAEVLRIAALPPDDDRATTGATSDPAAGAGTPSEPVPAANPGESLRGGEILAEMLSFLERFDADAHAKAARSMSSLVDGNVSRAYRAVLAWIAGHHPECGVPAPRKGIEAEVGRDALARALTRSDVVRQMTVRLIGRPRLAGRPPGGERPPSAGGPPRGGHPASPPERYFVCPRCELIHATRAPTPPDRCRGCAYDGERWTPRSAKPSPVRKCPAEHGFEFADAVGSGKVRPPNQCLCGRRLRPVP